VDLVGAVELTTSAAIVVAVVSIGLGRDGAARARIAWVLAGWFAVVVALAATRALHYERGLGVSGVGLAVVVPVVALSVMVMRLRALRAGLEHVPLAWLTAVHAVRVLGMSFVLLHTAGRLPAPFGPVAGWGDIAVGVTALPVAWMVSRRAAGWRPMLVAWNAIGLLDLMAAVALGVMSSPGPLRVIHAEPGSGIMATLPWLLIPGFLVPVLVVVHLAIFYRLVRGGMLAAKNPTLRIDRDAGVATT
jgi:hypothetical protein